MWGPFVGAGIPAGTCTRGFTSELGWLSCNGNYLRELLLSPLNKGGSLPLTSFIRETLLHSIADASRHRTKGEKMAKGSGKFMIQGTSARDAPPHMP